MLFRYSKLYIRLFLNKKKFDVATLPITTGTISSPMGLGSDSLPVKVNLFDNEIYLADSMQFLLEFSLRFDTKGVFYIMPTFRGEDSDKRHLSQFHHSESEIKGSLNDVILLCEEYIKFLTLNISEKEYYKQHVSDEKMKEVKNIIDAKHFPRIKFKEAINLLKKNNMEDSIDKKDGVLDIKPSGEKWLMHYYEGPVWLTHFEHLSVPFYQAYDPDDSRYALNADLLIGIGETIGCGERLDSKDVVKSLDNHSVAREEYEWYIKMKEKFPLKTSGFGMGIERYIAWLFDEEDIRKIPYVYRDKRDIFYP